MVKKFIFIGGSKGIGKTSLAKAVSKNLNFNYINTGERFRKYRPDFDIKFIEELIYSNQNLVIDTHYAASSRKTPYSFHLGINNDSQQRLRKETIYSGKIILIEASPQIILARRIKDQEERRCLELSQIIEENNYNKTYSEIYSSNLGLPRIIFNNEESLDQSTRKILEVIKSE